MLAAVTPGPVITVAPDKDERYPWRYCTLRAAGMPGPWSLLSLGTALNALAERISRMPGPGELRSQHPARIIGRDAGLARLRGLVDQVPQASQVLLVTGEAGMGKTIRGPGTH